MDDTPTVRRRRAGAGLSKKNAHPGPSQLPRSGGFSKLCIFLGAIFSIGAAGYFCSPVDSVEFELPQRVEVEKSWKRDNVLEKGKRIIPGMVGPESIEVDEEGNLYTGLLDGRIIKVYPSATGAIGEGLIEIIRKGPIPGVEPIDGHIQPRPLGIRLYKEKILYVVDAYYGLYSLNLETKEVRSLVKPSDVEPSLKFPNGLDITKDGKLIYFTDTSGRWNLRDIHGDAMEGSCTGRLFRFTTETNAIVTLSSNLCFANGVQLSLDETTIALSETFRCRVLFFDVKNGHVDAVTVVPGLPDNIRRSQNGGYWVAMPVKRTKLFDYLSKLPLLRKILTGIIPLEWVKHFGDSKMGVAVELDSEGEIIGIIYDENGRVSSAVSEVYETKSGLIFAGSYKEPFMVKSRR